jgi:hypothetical protein
VCTIGFASFRRLYLPISYHSALYRDALLAFHRTEIDGLIDAEFLSIFSLPPTPYGMPFGSNLLCGAITK